MADFNPIIVALFVILGSNCLCKAGEMKGYTMTPKEWNYWFDYVFKGPRETSAIVTTLLRLHENTPIVDTNKKEMVEFWHDAVMDQQEHCTFEYLSTLKEEYKKYQDMGYKRNFTYDFVHRKVINDCMYRFLKGVGRVQSLNSKERSSLSELGTVWVKKTIDKLPDDVEELKKRAAKLIGPTIPAEARKDKNDFVEYWRNKGTCHKLLAELEGPTMELEKFYKKFDPGYKSHRYDANDANNWIHIVEGCKFFLKDQPLYEIWPYVQKLSSNPATV